MAPSRAMVEKKQSKVEAEVDGAGPELASRSQKKQKSRKRQNGTSQVNTDLTEATGNGHDEREVGNPKKKKKMLNVQPQVVEANAEEEEEKAEEEMDGEVAEQAEADERDSKDEPDVAKAEMNSKKGKKTTFTIENLGGTTQVEGIMSTTAFESLPVSEPTKNALKDTGFTHMTEVRNSGITLGNWSRERGLNLGSENKES